ncbi:SulP family inorganic anion transporter [Thermomonospora umbrina]|uniref:SulP family inorganic anion transporter n=1 Tax=Thermomonospora umbrina TaxID=111806 RepID=UPI000E280470|nr:bifunctional SulP family inorganic anion transporter/carbonic anhydrase [Thermomonospora umbrina]
MTSRPQIVGFLRRDLPASFVVFLVAVPLSLGLAVASGAPVVAGLIGCIVGGVVAGALGGSPLTVSGPTAGLTIILASTVQNYGWRATCAITFMAGLVQLALGFGRVARTALAVSPAVVQGMLAGVTVVLILAQIHIVLGGSPQHSALANIRELPGQLAGHHSHAVLIGLLTIAVLLAWGRLPVPWRGVAGTVARRIPAPLPAIVAAAVTAWALNLDVPRVELPGSLLEGWQPPVMPSGPVPEIAGVVIAIAVLAGVETLLTSVSMDRMRPDGVPRADLDRELAGQGAANTVSGLLGGLPVAGVVIRSTANVNAGARTRYSTVMHGLWVLLLALVCGPLIEQVPLSALAALLVAMGVRLLDNARVRDLRNHGEASVYFITLGGVVAFGLGEGVLLGIGVTAWMALRRLTRLSVDVEEADGRWHVMVSGSLTFLGVPRLIGMLRRVPAGSAVDLDLNVDFMDHAAFEAVHDWRMTHERQGGEVDIDEIHETWYERRVTGDMTPTRKSFPPVRWWAPWANRWRRSENPELDAPEVSASALLLAGVREYHGQMVPLVRPIMAELAFKQTPEHLFITCVDSRVVPNIITASGPGDLFIVRNVGNLVPRHGSRVSDDSLAAALEYATNVLDVKTITVCGHSNCGAMAGVLAGGAEIDHLPGLSRWLKHANHSLARFLDSEPGAEPPLSRLCQINVRQQLDNLLTYPWLRNRVEAGKLELVGLYLDLETAKVHILDRPAGSFVPVPDEAPDELPDLPTVS